MPVPGVRVISHEDRRLGANDSSGCLNPGASCDRYSRLGVTCRYLESNDVSLSLKGICDCSGNICAADGEDYTVAPRNVTTKADEKSR